MAHFILCKICGKQKFINPAAGYVYCSRACREKDPAYAQKLWQRQAHHRVTLTCTECGKDYVIPRSIASYKDGTPRSKYCSWACKNLALTHQTGALHPGWTGGYQGYYGESWEAARRFVRERDGNQCFQCGKPKDENQNRNMEVHHLIPHRCFTSSEEANQVHNLVSLCIACHRRQLRVNFDNVKERFACVLYGVAYCGIPLPSVLSPLLLLKQPR